MQEQAPANKLAAIDRLAEHIREVTGGDVVIERLLGGGRTGQVYLADQPALDRKVAVKILLPRLARDPKSVIRFKQEAKAMAGCPHPGVVTVFTVGETASGLPFFVMEYIEGETLQDRLKRKGKLPPQEVVRIITAVATALTYAHERGCVHRDVRPSNVLMEQRTGRVLLTDFGLAKIVSGKGEAVTLTGTGEIMGTPAYLSPEQAESGTVNERSDQYSLAVMTYELLTGRLPFEGPEPQDYVRQHAEATPPWLLRLEPALPIEVSKVIDRGLMKEPGARFASAEAFGEALRGAAAAVTRTGHAARQKPYHGYERQLVQAGAICAGAAWGVLEATTWVIETFNLPNDFRQPAMWLVIAAFPVTLGVVWHHLRSGRQSQAELALR